MTVMDRERREIRLRLVVATSISAVIAIGTGPHERQRAGPGLEGRRRGVLDRRLPYPLVVRFTGRMANRRPRSRRGHRLRPAPPDPFIDGRNRHHGRNIGTSPRLHRCSSSTRFVGSHRFIGDTPRSTGGGFNPRGQRCRTGISSQGDALRASIAGPSGRAAPHGDPVMGNGRYAITTCTRWLQPHQELRSCRCSVHQCRLPLRRV